MQLQYEDDTIVYEVDFKKISKNVVQITGNFPVKVVGFTLSRETYEDNWDYSAYATIYREVENGCQFSNDGSVYVEPVIPIPTEEELVLMEEQKRIANINAQINNLKEQLASTDYKIIKCTECNMVGLELPYNINELHDERQIIRDMINEKENEL